MTILPVPPPEEPTPTEEWQRVWYTTAHADIQWAKGQGWQAVQWTIVLLVGVAAARDQLHNLAPWFIKTLIGIITAVSLIWLVDLNRFANKARGIANRITTAVPGSATYIKRRSFDPAHIFYLVVRMVAVVTAASVTWLGHF